MAPARSETIPALFWLARALVSNRDDFVNLNMCSLGPQVYTLLWARPHGLGIDFAEFLTTLGVYAFLRTRPHGLGIDLEEF